MRSTSSTSAPDLDEDQSFDYHLPQRVRVKSAFHFTPVTVARRAAQLLAPRDGMRVLDVGAGPGKFCVIAARERPTCKFVGIEQRPLLVELAQRLAHRMSAANATFLQGDALEHDWSGYDALYLFNPFGELLLRSALTIDQTVLRSQSRFEACVDGTRAKLAALRPGTRVVTYHGLGAAAPDGYELAERVQLGTDVLELWIKAAFDAAPDEARGVAAS